MTRHYTDREMYGIEFDNRLIQLVRGNPAIYDVQHPHYRRNQVRIAIWERIAYELAAPSKFVQTKWKNIRYNYLQELKSKETGIVNTNIRKRRFTEDLSFLQNTAQTYNMDNRKRPQLIKSTSVGGGSDNESNGYIYTDNNASVDAFEVIEIEHSDDGCVSYNENDDLFGNNSLVQSTDIQSSTQNNCSIDNERENLQQNVASQGECDVSQPSNTIKCKAISPTDSMHSNRSSPLLTPMVALTNGRIQESLDNGITSYAEGNNSSVTAITKQQPHPVNTNTYVSYKTTANPAAIETLSNITRRKAMPAPFPVLTPINDPIELYCLSLVDSLRNMSRAERERVKYEFANILKDAKYINES